MLPRCLLICLICFLKGLPVAKKKKSKKYDDYVDLGAGYDENDPFIDNTDAVVEPLLYITSFTFKYRLIDLYLFEFTFSLKKN